MNTQMKTGILVASLVVVAVVASFAKRSDVYLLTLYCAILLDLGYRREGLAYRGTFSECG